MDVIVKRCAGLDVHKQTVFACVGLSLFLHFPLDTFLEPLREPSLTGSKGRVYGR